MKGKAMPSQTDDGPHQRPMVKMDDGTQEENRPSRIRAWSKPGSSSWQ